MPANLENSAVATGLEKVSFHSNSKEGQYQRSSNYHTIAFISHASKVMVKILQAKLWQHMNCEIPDVPAGFRKGRGSRDQIANIRWIIEKARESRKTSMSAFLLHQSLCVDHNTLWKILQEMGIPDHLTCFLRDLYKCQDATVRTQHGKTDWFQIGKGIHQGCILSPCLFNLYAEYISKMLGWMKHKLESRSLGETSITSDRQMAPPLWQKVKRN